MLHMPSAAAPRSLRAFRTATLASASIIGLMAAAPSAAQNVNIAYGTTETVDGFSGGTKPSPWNITGDLGVQGTLEILWGGSVTNNNARIDEIADGGSVLVDGSGSTWNTFFHLTVGESFKGTLTVANGGTVRSQYGYIGERSGSEGTVTVTGLDARWNITEDLLVGNSGSGTLRVEDLATVTAKNIYVAGTSATPLTVASQGIIETGQLAKFPGSSGGLVTFDGGRLRLTGAQADLFSGLNVSVVGFGATIDTQAFDVATSAPITGNGSLTKQGAGTLTLSGVNTYTGKTFLIGGTLQAGSATAFSAGSTYEFHNDATLDLNGFSATIGGLAASSVTGAVVLLGGGSTLTVAQTSDTDFMGKLSGGGSLVKSGTGALTLSGDNSGFTGTIVVAGGTLNAGFGSTFAPNTSYIVNGGTLDLNYQHGFSMSALSGTGGTIVLGGGGLTVEQASNTDYAGSFSGSGTIVKTGGGILTLSGDNSGFMSGFAVAGGTLKAGSATAFKQNGSYIVHSGTLDLGGHALTMGNFSGDGGTVALGAANLNVDSWVDSTYAGSFTGTGTLTKQGTSTLTLSGNNSGFAGNIVVADGTLQAGSATAFTQNGNYTVNGGTLDLNDYAFTIGSLSGSGGRIELGSGSLTVAQAGNTNYAGDFAGSGTFTKQGTGILTLSGNNSGFYGSTVVEGGTLRAGSGTAFAYNGRYTLNGGTLDLGGHALTMGSLSGTGGTIALGGASLTLDQWQDTTYAGSLTGTGTFATQGTSILTLSGNNSGFTGNTQITNGTLRAGSTTALSAGSTYQIDNGATLDLNGFNSTIGGLTADGAVLLNGGAQLLLQQDSNTTFSGAISGDGGLVKVGTGVLTLSGDNSGFTGTTGVGSGTLRAASSTAFAQNSYYIVNGGTLDLGGHALTMSALSGTGGTIALGTASLTVQQVGNTVYAGSFTGSGSFTNLGPGTLTLSGNNSGFTGNTIVAGGALKAGSATAFTQNGSYTVNSGTLDLDGNNSTIGGLSGTGGTVALGAANLTVQQAGNTDYAGSITGSGSFTKQSGGTLTLSGDNSGFTGNTTVAGGTLKAGSGLALSAGSIYDLSGGALDLNDFSPTIGGLSGSGAVWLTGGATLTVAQNGNTSYGGNIQGYGTLIKQGSGTLTLSGSSFGFGGTTVVESGTLRAGASTAFRQNEIYIVNGGTLDLGGHALTMSALSGSGGTVALGGASLTVTQTGNASFLGAISGTGTFTKQGTGTLTLAGNNSGFTGNTTVTAGVLTAASGFAFTQNGSYTLNGGTLDLGGHAVTIGALSGTSGSVALGVASLTVQQAGDTVYAGSLTGIGGTFTKQGTGILTLSGNNSGFNGSTVVAGGRLKAGSASGLVQNGSYTVNSGTLDLGGHALTMGSLVGTGGTVALGAANLAVAQAADTTFAGNLTGTGGFTKQGTGTLTLTGNNSGFGGSTTVSGGTLVVGAGGTGTLGGAVTVWTGGRLGGSGTIGGSVTVVDGVLAPGNSPGTLTISGDLSLAGNSTLAFELGQAGTVGGALNDHIVVGGNLVLDGTLDVSVSAGGTFGAGVYRLISYGGTLTDNGLTLGTMPAGSEVSLQTAVHGQINLVNTAGLTLGYWDGTTGLNNGLIEGGSGVWRAGSSTSWTDEDGALNGGYTDASFAVFGGTGGTVTLDASQGALRASGLQFLTDGYVLTGDALTLTGPAATLRVGDGTAAGAGMTATLHSTLTGASQLVKTDLGTLVLTGANSYTGGTLVAGGTLKAGSVSAFAQNGLYIVNGGTLDLGGHALTMRTLSGTGGTVALGTADLVVDQASDTTFAGSITGSGTLSKLGGGTLTLTGNNSTFAGSTVLEGGTLRAGSATAFAQNGIYVINGGTLDLNNYVLIMSELSGTGGTVALGAASLTLTQATDTTFAGSITGTGSLIKQGGGTLTLSGAARHTGGTVVEAGTLRAGSANAFVQNGRYTVNGGTLVLGGHALTMSALVGTGGTVAIGAASLTLAQATDTTFAGSLTGTGSLDKQGSGTLILTGDSSGFGGSTTVSGGTLMVGAGGVGALGGDVRVETGGRLGGSGTIGGNVIVADGVLAPGNSPGTLSISGDLSLAGGSLLAFELGQAGTIGGALNDHIIVGGNLVLDGTLDVSVSAGGTVGAGVYRLISYGGTLIDNGLTLGTMPAGSEVRLQTAVQGQVNLVNTAGLTLSYWDGTTGLHNGVIEGGSGVWRAGPSMGWTDAGGLINGGYTDASFAVFGGTGGTVVVNASQGAVRASGLQFMADGYVLTGDALTLTGPVSTLRVGDGTAAGAGMTATVHSALTGAAQLVKTDLGTLILTGANSYTGGTVVEAGTLRAGSATAFVQNGRYTVNGGALDLGGHALTMSSLSGTGGTVALGAASLTLAQSTDTTFAGSLTGTGGLTKQGGGTLTLSGANTYTGGTVVEAGTLRAGSANAFRQNGSYTLNGGTLDLNGHALTIAALSGSGGAIALGGAALTLALEADTTFAGNLTGAGALIKQGGGTLIFTGDNSGFAGTVRLAQGHMVVGRGGAATLGGTVELGAGGRLSGSGTVGSTVVGTNAILAPGNSIGTLTVSGDLTLGAGSLYEVEVDPTGSASDRVHITGKARLEGGTVLHLGEAGEYQPLARYTILTADGGVEGTFGAVRSQFAFLTPTLSYAANTVSLELARNTARFADAAATRNQRATAEAAERLGAGHAVYDALLLLPDDAARVRHAFEQLSGEVHASARSVLLEDSRFVREAVAQQLRSGSGGGLWTQTFGGWGRRSGDGNAARLTHNTQGILLGWDAALGAGSAGVVAGYGNADLSVSQRASSAEAETYHLGLYWGARLGNVSLRGGAAYSWHDVETRRDATVAALSQTLRADYKSASVQAFAEAAWAVTLGRATLEPFAGLAHVINTTDNFAETGGTAGLAGGGGALAVTFGTLGLNARLGFDLGRLPAAVHTSFGWQHAFGETAPTARLGFSASDLFTVAGSPLARDAARLQTGLQLAVSERTSLGLGYSGQFAGGVEKHDLSARFSVRF